MSQTFIVLSTAGPNRNHAIATREQPFWGEHERFIDTLVEDGFIVLGGPLVDEGGAMLVVRAASEAEVRRTLEPDPWYRHGILRLEAIRRWEIFIDRRGG